MKAMTGGRMDINLLKKVPIFSLLDDGELEKIRKLCVTKHYEKDRIILIEEESGNTLFIIQEGRVKVSRMSDDGREVILTILQKGDFFGELSLLDGKARSASVTAIENTEILLLRRGDFMALLEQYPQISISLLKELAARIRKSDTQIKSLSLQDAMGRVASALVMLAEDSGRIKKGEVVIPKIPLQQDLANMAGTSRETISRVFRCLEDDKLIIRNGRRIVIPDFQRFKKKYL
ncbi:MAG: Crp/Fnr family transcriptional regulator [candidate division KSB1 bacterium]|nr:Crp/Fnr family transcriptional regulator [candidate division KSB1 bacterium]MDZ7339790.1 Crp/Fnr family transcriptional regulator [candidate division KSB1 bacterium]